MNYALRFLFFISMLLVVACHQRPVREKYIGVHDSNVFITDQGEGDVVLLLHGGLMDQTMWKHQVIALVKDHRVLTMDLRGHGKSITGASDYIQIDAIRKVFDSLKIEKASIVGHSLGAIVALDFARNYAERTSKVALIAPGLFGFNLNHDSLLNKYSGEMGTAYSKSDTSAFIEGFIRAWYDGHVKQQDINPDIRYYTKNMVTSTMKVNQWKYGPLLSTSPGDSAALHELKEDVLVIYGDQDMSDIAMIGELIEQEVPTTHKEVIKGGAHMLPLTFPDQVNELLKAFLKR